MQRSEPPGLVLGRSLAGWMRGAIGVPVSLLQRVPGLIGTWGSGWPRRSGAHSDCGQTFRGGRASLQGALESFTPARPSREGIAICFPQVVGSVLSEDRNQQLGLRTVHSRLQARRSATIRTPALEEMIGHLDLGAECVDVAYSQVTCIHSRDRATISNEGR